MARTLPARDKLVERAERLFQLGDRAGEMRVENVDVIGLQAAQTGLDDAGDDAARQALFRRIRKPGPASGLPLSISQRGHGAL